MTIRPGGINGESAIDRGLLKAPRSQRSDVLMLDCEFTVVEGPYARRKFWQNFTVAGRQGRRERRLDRAGTSPRARFRAMIDSALGLDPQGHERGGEGEAHPARSCRSLRHHLRRQDQGRVQRQPGLRRQEPARPCRAADRARVAARSWTAKPCRRGRARGGSRRPRRLRPQAHRRGDRRRRRRARDRPGARAPPPASPSRHPSPRPARPRPG